jgi:hypothetical protein
VDGRGVSAIIGGIGRPIVAGNVLES